MGQFVAGNTRPVTGWRDWKKRLAPHLSGAYTPATFPLPTITPKSFWSAGGYRRARFPVPMGMGGTFERTQVLDQPSKWGLSGPFDDTLAWVEQNAGKILAGSVGLLLLVGGLKRRRRR